jgi:hypothetical protein
MRPKKVYLVCPVRRCPPEITAEMDEYVAELERNGYKVHYPPRDADQTQDGVEICLAHWSAMVAAEEIHLWWVPGISTGTYFDFGMAYMLYHLDAEAGSRAIKFVIANPHQAPDHNQHSYYYVLNELEKATADL